MQAAHDARGVPLVVGDVLDRRVRVGDAGIEKDVQVDAGAGNDPEEVPAQRAEMPERDCCADRTPLEDSLGLRESMEKRLGSHVAIPSTCRHSLTMKVADRAQAQNADEDRHRDRVVERVAAAVRVVHRAEELESVDPVFDNRPHAAC